MERHSWKFNVSDQAAEFEAESENTLRTFVRSHFNYSIKDNVFVLALANNKYKHLLARL